MRRLPIHQITRACSLLCPSAFSRVFSLVSLNSIGLSSKFSNIAYLFRQWPINLCLNVNLCYSCVCLMWPYMSAHRYMFNTKFYHNFELGHFIHRLCIILVYGLGARIQLWFLGCCWVSQLSQCALNSIGLPRGLTNIAYLFRHQPSM